MIKEKHIFSNYNNKLLLHKIIFPDYKNNDDKFKRYDLSPNNEYLQVAYIKMPKDHTFLAHQHKFRQAPSENIITQECWIILNGSVKVDYYDINGKYLESEILNKGDATITYMGGHNYTALEKNTIVYEIKTGPYINKTIDKIRYSDPEWENYKKQFIEQNKND